MRALTLVDPWASLIAMGHKNVETRPWPTVYRGWVLIHAGKSRECIGPAFVEDLLARAGIPGLIGTEYAWPHLGKVMARARIVDCVPTASIRDRIPAKERALGDYSDGRFAFILRDVEALPEPIPAKGALGLWGPMDSLVADVDAQLARARPVVAVEAPQGPPPGAPPMPEGIERDAEKWARESGMSDPLGHVGQTYGPLDGSWALTIQELARPYRIGTARYAADGKRTMWTLDTKGVL